MSRRSARQPLTKTRTKPVVRKPVARAAAPHLTESDVSANSVRTSYGLSREKFARLTGASVRALSNWENGRQKPNEAARLRLVELARLQRALSSVIRSESMTAWLEKPNPAFEGLKPLEVIERGQIDRLWRMVFLLESGVPA